MGYDYENGNCIVDWVLELNRRDAQAIEKIERKRIALESDLKIDYSSIVGKIKVTKEAPLQARATQDRAERAERLLEIMGCNTREGAEIVLSELRRERDEWGQRRESRVGLSIFIALIALGTSASALIVNLPKLDIDNSCVDTIRFVATIVAIAAILVAVVSTWRARSRYNKKAKVGQIAEITSLIQDISAWLLKHPSENLRQGSIPK